MREEFVNPPAEKLEQKETVEGQKPRVRGQFWFYVPDELIREAFHFKDEGWPEKLGIAPKSKGPKDEQATTGKK
eukprot:gnl/Chilomastix_caulleri/8639.p1 GENE.gnl/Chilomastix_caulleri/8639~~gnl/Chilomastix_caulleri/8639.p1  ORF type:complete len:74 (+),score=33.21 gnl/Chilomastix_caulleri/8639:58-279(+)